MRAHEFITEVRQHNAQGDKAHGFDKSTGNPLVTTYVFPSMPGNNAYRAYRFAMAMANHEIAHEDGPTSQFAVISAYTDGDEEIIKSALKKTKEIAFISGKQGSTEVDNTNTVSPVSQPRRNKYGV